MLSLLADFIIKWNSRNFYDKSSERLRWENNFSFDNFFFLGKTKERHLLQKLWPNVSIFVLFFKEKQTQEKEGPYLQTLEVYFTE